MSDVRARHVVPYDAVGSFRVEVSPERAGWDHLTFHVHTMAAGQRYPGESLDREVCLVFLSGDASVKTGAGTFEIRGRSDVFRGLPHAVYVKPDDVYEVAAQTDLEVAVGFARAEGRLPTRLIRPEDVTVEIRGGHNATRQITHVLDPGDAEHLLCVEVYTPSGNWSSYPPHRHDLQDPPGEVALDEIYHYRIQPPGGWAMQRLYTDDRTLDDVVIARHGDTVLVRQGYHPVVMPPGYDGYYLNFLAGPTPSWVARDEPDLAWVRDHWEGAPERLRLPLKGTDR